MMELVEKNFRTVITNMLKNLHENMNATKKQLGNLNYEWKLQEYQHALPEPPNLSVYS